MRPICAHCNNKITDNTYVWLNDEKILVHKICRIINQEMTKNITINVSPMKMGTRVRG